MAKKTEGTHTGPGAGIKLCNPTDGVSCKSYIGARAHTCPKCGKAQLIKAKKEKTEKGGTPLLDTPNDDLMIQLVQSAGGIDKAINLLKPFDGFEVSSVLLGLEKVEKFLALVETLGKKR